MITTLISIGVFIGFVIWYLIKEGVPENLSSTYYKVGSLFTVVLALCAFLLLPGMGLKGFPIVISILLVACAPRFKEFELKIHMVGALSAMLLSQIYVVMDGKWWLMGLLLLPWWLSRKNWLFWIELIFFLEIYVNEVLKQI